MKEWELKNTIKDIVEDAADAGMLEYKESKTRADRLQDIKDTAFERLKDTVI